MLLSVWKNWIKVIFLDGWIPGHVEHKRLLTSEMMSGSEMMYHNESQKRAALCWQRSHKLNCYFMKAGLTQKAVSTAWTKQKCRVDLKPGICTGQITFTVKIVLGIVAKN